MEEETKEEDGNKRKGEEKVSRGLQFLGAYVPESPEEILLMVFSYVTTLLLKNNILIKL